MRSDTSADELKPDGAAEAQPTDATRGPRARRFGTCAVAALGALLASLAFASARGVTAPTCTITWTGGAGTTAWATAANWSTGVVPGASDHVCIPVVPAAVVYSSGSGTTSILSLQAQAPVSLTGGTLNLTDTDNASNVATFSQSAGTLGGAATLNIGGTYTWTGGTMSDAGTTQVAAGAALSQGGSTTLANGRLLEVVGTYSLTADVSLNASGTAPSIHNGGTLQKSAGSGTSTIFAALDNDGSVVASSGTLSLRAGTGTSTGSFGAAAAVGTVQFDTGTHTLTGAALPGHVRLAGGTLQVTAGSTVTASGANSMSGGTLGGTGTFSLTGGTWTWTGGTMSDAGTTTVAAGATLSQGGSTTLANGRLLEVAGTYSFTADVSLSPSGTAPSIHNSGTLQKSAGSGTSTIFAALDNDGSVAAASGTLSLRAGTGTSTGSFGAAAANGTVSFTAGSLALAGATLLGKTTLAGATLTVPAGASVTATGTNSFSSGTLGGPGTFNVAGGTLNWTGGTMTDAGTTTVSAGATLAQDGSILLASGRLLENAGTYDFKSDRTVSESGSPAPSIHNTGTIRKTGGTATATINPGLANEGTVTSTSGKLSLLKSAGGTQPGTFAGVGDADHVIFAAGTFTLGSATTLQGTVEIGGATVQIAGGATVAVPDRLLLTSGELGGAGSIDVAGALAWSGGIQSGPGTTLVGAGGRIEVGAPSCVVSLRDGRSVQSSGTIALHHSSLILAGNTPTVIDNAGRIDLDDAAAGTSCGGSSLQGGLLRVNNAAGATISKFGSTSPATQVTSIDGLRNDGLVDVQAGTLNLSSASAVTHSGAFSSSGAGSRIAFRRGTFVMAPGVTLAGQSAINDPAARVEISAETTLRIAPGDTLTMSSGTLAGAGTLSVGGTFAWSGGSQLDSGTTIIEPGGNATVTRSVAIGLGRVFVNRGSLVWDGGNLSPIIGGASLVNAGTFELRSSLNQSGFGFDRDFLFHNTGLVTKTGAAVSNISILVDNDGTIEVDGGRLVLGRLLNYGGDSTGTLTAGSYVVRGAALNLPGNVRTNAAALVLDGSGASATQAVGDLATNAGSGELALENGHALTTPGPFRNNGIVRLSESSSLTTTGAYHQSGGVTDLAGAAARLTAAGAGVQVAGGRFGGIGSAGPTLDASGGTIEPGLGVTGVLHADAYSAGAGATLRTQIADVAPGTGFDQLAVTGAAALGGTLAIETAPGFHPTLGQTFQILTFASHTGTFSSVTGLSLGDGLVYDVVYNATDVTLVVASEVGETYDAVERPRSCRVRGATRSPERFLRPRLRRSRRGAGSPLRADRWRARPRSSAASACS
jgi:hypothetical protein